MIKRVLFVLQSECDGVGKRVKSYMSMRNGLIVAKVDWNYVQ